MAYKSDASIYPSIRQQVPYDARFIQIERLSDAIKTEFELVTARIGWFATAQAFIVAAFCQTVATGDWGRQSPPTLKVIAYELPWLGVVSAILVYVSVAAAHTTVERLKHQRDHAISLLPLSLQYTLVPVTSPIHTRGNLPAKYLPLIVELFWLTAYLSLIWPPSIN